MVIFYLFLMEAFFQFKLEKFLVTPTQKEKPWQITIIFKHS